MVDIPLFGSNGPPAVRQPIFEVQFGSPDAGAGLDSLAGSMGSALGIDLGTADAWQDHLVSLSVETGLAPFVDMAEFVVATGSQAPSVAVGDAGTISLGYTDDAARLVFTGQVERVRHGMGAIAMMATNGGAQLARLRINQSYEQQSAGELVTALAAQAGVDTDTVEDGIDFPFYVVDDGYSAYQQVAQLARKSDYAAWFTPAGKLNFAPLAEGDPVATFTYGENILALRTDEATLPLGAATAVGEGAAGSQGASAWSWLVKDPAPVTGNAGSGTPKRLLQNAALRNSDAVQRAANAASNAAGRWQIRGRLLAPGAPSVIPGSTITIASAPQAVANGNFLVQRVRHHLSKEAGFTTLVVFSKPGDGGADGLLGGFL
jgi:phage protein D